MMARHGMASLLLAAILGWSACGGSGKSAAEPAEPAAESDAPADGDVLIPAESLDQIQSLFERKNRMVSSCFGDALEAGEIEQDVGQVRLTARMTITEGGRATAISFSDSNVSSPVLERCIRDHISGWSMPTLPKPLDYSYTFGFSTL